MVYLVDPVARTIAFLSVASKTAHLFVAADGECLPASWRQPGAAVDLRIMSEEEPDPSLFVVPSDYRIEKSAAGGLQTETICQRL